MCIASTCLALLLVSPVFAEGLTTLTPGAYQAGAGGCAHPTGAGTMTFDGKNLSGNHQYCRTEAIGASRYRLTCMDLMQLPGAKAKTAADFDADPDKESVELTIKVLSSTRLTIDGQLYVNCGRAK